MNTTRHLSSLALLLTVATCAAQKPQLKVDATSLVSPVSPTLYSHTIEVLDITLK